MSKSFKKVIITRGFNILLMRKIGQQLPISDNIYKLIKNWIIGSYIRIKREGKTSLSSMKKDNDKEELRVLTIEELREFDGLGDLSDTQAKKMIEVLKNLSLMAHNIVCNNEYIRTIPRIREKE